MALTGIAFIGIGDMISVQIDWCEQFFHESPSQTVEIGTSATLPSPNRICQALHAKPPTTDLA